MGSTRRDVLAGLAALPMAALPLPAAAQEPRTIRLWPGRPPGGDGPDEQEQLSAKGAITRVGEPRLIVHRPLRPTGAAVLVAAGGGYFRIERGTESEPAAAWLASLGVTAFELIYRLPRENWTSQAPFQDAQRAMRIVRARAGEMAIDPKRIGVLGFSAGGHLAAMTAVAPSAARYAPVDAADPMSARPDFAGLIYPVITMLPPYNTTRSFRELLGPGASEAQMRALSPQTLVDGATPPLFIAQAEDDPISPVQNSLLMFAAAQQAKVAAELQIFPTGGHGWGMGAPGSFVAQWPGLFARWLALGGFAPAA
jgi:acetyl esterase/lipase